MSKTIAFKVDEAFYQELKSRVDEQDQTLKGYIISLIEKDLSKSDHNANNLDNSKITQLEAALRKQSELHEILVRLSSK